MTDSAEKLLREKLRDAIATVMVEHDPMGDNLATALCSYFEAHINCPDDGEETEHGWEVWASEKTEDALTRIAANITAHLSAQPAESGGDGLREAYEDCIAKLQGLQINLTDVPEYAADYAARVAKATLLGCISEIRQRVASLPTAPTPAASGTDEGR